MGKKNYYLVTALTHDGKRMNLCVTNRREHAKSVASDYSDRKAKFSAITDVRALEIIFKSAGCQIALFDK